MSSTLPDWAQVGTEVVVYQLGRMSGYSGRVERIERVTPTTIVLAKAGRFRADSARQDSRSDVVELYQRNGDWSAGTYVCPLDSERGRERWAQINSRERLADARHAASAFDRHPDMLTLAALRGALVVLVDGDVPEGKAE